MAIRLNAKTKSLFFDRDDVIKAMDEKQRKSLSRFGAFVRRRARTSIRRRKRVSAPGKPPSAHSKDKFATPKNILFFYDPSSASVIIGPVAINGQIGNPLRALEFGGRHQFERTFSRYLKGVKTHKYELVTATYRARPFMQPALEAELPNMDKAWNAYKLKV